MKKETGEFGFKLTWIAYATPEEVFNALADEKIIADWTGDEAVLEPKPGGRFQMFGNWVAGEVLVYEPGKKLSYSWKPNTWDKKAAASNVVYTFKKNDAGTAVILEHTGFPNQKEADSHKDGWTDNVFEPLNDYFIAMK